MTTCCPTCGQVMPQRPELVVDLDTNTASRDGMVVRLSRTEAELARCLVDAKRRTLSREQLLSKLYGYSEEPTYPTIDQFILKIRRKLKPLGVAIVNHWGRGWSLTVGDA
jgi:DNA-binding response OmpR family regulator